jgi:hypothetical protein
VRFVFSSSAQWKQGCSSLKQGVRLRSSFKLHDSARSIIFYPGRGFTDGVSALIQSVIAQAQNVVVQLQGHASNLSQQAIQQVSNLIEQLRAVATLAHGKVLSTIQGLIATLQGFCKS